MKIYSKFILLATFLAFAQASTAQSKSQVQMIQSGVITRTGDINWSKAIETDLIMTFDGNDVYIDDKANTHIRTYGKSEEYEGVNGEGERFTKSTWSAYDERGKSCNFIMMYFKDMKLSVYAIVYNDIAFRYYIRKPLSNFNL